MSNFFKSVIGLGLCALAFVGATPAQAQRGWDAFGGTRVLQVWQPTLLNFVSGPIFTNDGTAGSGRGIVDTRMFDGTAVLSITSFTNAGGALTVQPYTSSDGTNWTAMTNFATVTSTTSVLYTNSNYGTNLQISDPWLLPGTYTTPTASTAGWASAYVLPAPYTNGGAITITAKGTYLIGYNIGDATRYLQLAFTPTGSSSNDVVAATLIGFVHGEVK